jgi:tyrosine-protein phosphatase SIW14
MITRFVLACLLLSALPAADRGDPEQFRVRPADWAQPVLGTGLENLHQVTPELYRCEQPGRREMARLAEAGIRSVLNLRDNHDDDDEAEGLALALYRVEIETDDIGDAEVIAALRIIRDAPKPVVVHCWHGADRTGCVIAMYRILNQGWTREAAIDEMINGGYDFHATWDNIPASLRTTDIDAVRAAVTAP